MLTRPCYDHIVTWDAQLYNSINCCSWSSVYQPLFTKVYLILLTSKEWKAGLILWVTQ